MTKMKKSALNQKGLALSLSKGFTLVEMLIVIAVIGVLAVAVLSAINPIEQMRKARDTRRRSNAAELLNAVERYYATNEVNPPELDPGSSIPGVAGAGDDCATAVAAGTVGSAALADLETANELKANFLTRVDTTGNELYVGMDTTTDLTTVCYQVESQANIQKYFPGGVAIGTYACIDTTLYYVCVPE